MDDWAPQGSVDAVNRGLLYGHGCFETIRVAGDEAPLLRQHEARFLATAARLGFGVPPAGWLAHRIRTSKGQPDRVVRIVLTCTATSRGYAPPRSPQLVSFTESFAVPDPFHGNLEVGIQRVLGGDPLPGAKHVSRLGQVLSHPSRTDEYCADDSLLVDDKGFLVEALAANILVHLDGAWLTPDLTSGGVAGTFRAWLLERGAAQQARMHVGMLARCTSVLLVNSVRGYMPVSRVEYFGQYEHGATRKLMSDHPIPW